MTARETWKYWYRKQRVLQREYRKAQEDALMFGTGSVVFLDGDDARHVRKEDYYTESSKDA